MAAQGPDPAAPLWRAAQVFRLLGYLYALGFQIAVNGDLERPLLAWSMFAGLTVWTVFCAVAYLHGFGRRPGWVIAELAVSLALLFGTLLVASPDWVADNQSLPTTLWLTNATVSAAILWGPVGGVLTAALIMAAYALEKGAVEVNLGRSAGLVIELAVGLAVGLAARTARRVHAELERAARLTAAASERERLARQMHDGVIQVLALVARRGREIGGPTAELAELAAEQERVLRRFAHTGDLAVRPTADGDADGRIDLRPLLDRYAGDRVTVAMPATAVPLPAEDATELAAAVRNALDNVALHAGLDARAYVLVEDLDDEVVVSVRDDGAGIAPGRLEAARAEGRMGIDKSIVGRLSALAGTAVLHSDDEGTEWELTVPRSAGKAQR
ncbi:MacS family sensor histidine kinase [Mycolicibacterium brumae]|uniref:Sensor histidine kinase n=1 Tax=Mycolicibacterium brumae TaxID=85968 RepID=A0A2G5P759_9MYCO|nr:DUF5931 domain-containing protein [Mycolicibacterium brumae]MCV7194608.1 ATP-binding protein [Mycolicibacterium brumae]PIB74208.1 sensor histidine kinase [Mycolicibacterium brumae]UWW08947.1 DUF5931 domain-containing protein [Mycolicibacterium brumae]